MGDSIQFPVVSICTYARVNASEVRNLGISDALLSFMLSSYKVPLTFPNPPPLPPRVAIQGMYLFYNEFQRQKMEEQEPFYRVGHLLWIADW